MRTSRGWWIGVLVCGFCLRVTTPVFSQDTISVAKDTFDIKSASFYLPQALPKKDFRHIFWVSQFFLPSDWTNIAIGAPMFNYSARYALPAGFSIEGTVSTLYVSNRALLGPRWNYSWERLHVGVSYFYGYNLGILNDLGFSTLVTSWNHIPGLSIGYSFNKTAITLRVGAEYLGNFYYRTGDNVVTSNNFHLNGTYIGAVIEQRLWKDHVMSFGFEMDHMNFIMLAWPAYPVNKKIYDIPQVTFGLTL